MSLPNVIRINGKLHSRRSVSVRPNGAFLLTAIDTIEWSDEVQQDLVNGMNQGGPPLGKTDGNYNCSASLSVYSDYVTTFEQQIRLLSPLAGTDLSDVNFQLPILIREDLRVYTAVLVDCSIKGRSMSVSNDGSALVKQYTLQPRVIVENGLSLVNLLPSI